MSNQITEARVQGFKQGIDILSQQKGSRLQNAVRVEMQSSKQDHYDQISATSAVEKVSRHGDTPLVETPHSRRAVTLRDFEWADLIDKPDKMRVLNDPTNAYSRNAAFAMGRKKDEIVIEAMGGSALTGETGTGSQAYDTNNDVGSAGSGVDFNVANLLASKEILDLNDTDDEETFIMCTAHQLTTLLSDTTATSSDYNTIKALVQGEIDTYVGFKFIRMSVDLLPAQSGDRPCYFWRKSGVVLSIGEGESGTTARITERPDKSYSMQVFYSGSYGAVRLEEAKVGRLWAND